MKRTPDLFCEKMFWQGRKAYLIGNDLVRLVHLTGGGHIAEFRFAESSGMPTLNPLWTPPWKTIEPYRYRPTSHGARYGPPVIGRLLSGIVGHIVCLDFFGPPSEEEAREGLSVHGEAPVLRWRETKRRVSSRAATLTLSVKLPVASLSFSREVKLLRGESVAYFKETVKNERKADHFFQWQQHVTIGPPFLARQECKVAISATKAKTYPHGYEGKALLDSAREFQWPDAPGCGGRTADLREPLSRRGAGFLATALLNPRRKTQFVTALNIRHRLLIGYCFNRSDYPWVTLWEENCARTEPPWLGKTQARGLEFGSSPFLLRREALTLGPLFGTPTLCQVAARGQKTIDYVAFLAQVPRGFHAVHDIEIAESKILVRGPRDKDLVHVPASGLAGTGLL